MTKYKLAWLVSSKPSLLGFTQLLFAQLGAACCSHASYLGAAVSFSAVRETLILERVEEACKKMRWQSFFRYINKIKKRSMLWNSIAWQRCRKLKRMCCVWGAVKGMADPSDQWCSCGVYHPAIDFTSRLLFRFPPSLLALFSLHCCCFMLSVFHAFFFIYPSFHGRFAYNFSVSAKVSLFE